MFGPDKQSGQPKLDCGGRFGNMASVGDFNSFRASVPATKVELSVSCRNLLDRDTFSKSDPICVLYTQGIGSKEWREFGRTEVIDNTLNPDFVRKFIMDYFFEERENLRFDLYDVDSKSPNLSKHDFLGQVFCTLGEIVGSQGSRLEKAIVGIPGKNCGTIILTAEELNCCRDSVLMQFCANKLDKKDFFGKSDPFLVFYRSNEDGSFTICHKTEVVKNTLNPVWQAFKISVRALCNGDYDRTIKIEVYDWDRDGSHDFIGEFTTSYRELSRGQSQFNVYEVINPKKKGKKKKYINSGTVTLLSFLIETEVSFLDYIKGGHCVTCCQYPGKVRRGRNIKVGAVYVETPLHKFNNSAMKAGPSPRVLIGMASTNRRNWGSISTELLLDKEMAGNPTPTCCNLSVNFCFPQTCYLGLVVNGIKGSCSIDIGIDFFFLKDTWSEILDL
nr:copine-8-like isoform X2 [Chelonoidis abingdonii]